MDSAKSVLHSILLATQHVRNAIARYSTARGVRQVRQHSLVRFELEFQTIVDASRAILEAFDDPFLRRRYILDDRLMDWLSGPEPETCLDTLNEMERLLNIDHEVHVFSGFTPTRTGYQEDDISLAITRFYAHKAHFHFLLVPDIWNREKESPGRIMPSKTEGRHVHGQGQSQSTSTRNDIPEHQKKEIVSQKLMKLLRVFDALDCSRKQSQTSSTRQADTCMWLPATDAYMSWREGKDTFLWLQGKAGAGKSVLASSIINDLNNMKKDGELLVYFYCDFRTGRSTSSVEVMRSLLAQLTKHLCDAMMDPEPLLDELLKGANSHVHSFYSVKGLAHYLSKVAGSCPLKPLVVVDALDECREVETLLDALIMCNGDVRMFVTSRPLQNITQMLSHLPCISLDDMANELSADILLHITRELDSRSRLRTFNGGLKDEIRSRLCAKADGMFRWVQCQIDTLDKCTSVSEIRGVLESLPEGLEETYRRILIAIDKCPPDARLVRCALVWLVAALRPMRLRELLEGLTVDPIRRSLDTRFALIKGADFLAVSRSLVIHHKETDVITLSHMSVKEYLIGELVQDILPRYHIVLEDAHERLARLCMAYLAFCLDQLKECRDRSPKATRERDLMLTTSYASRPLLKYVLSDGFSHLAHLGSGNAGILKDMETLQAVICRCAWEWDRMCNLVPSLRSEVPWPNSEHDFTTYSLVAFASDALFHTFLARPLIPREGTNPLVYAAHFGKTDRARALILRGANVNHWGLAVDKSDTGSSDIDDMDVDGSDADDADSDTSMADYSDERKAMPIQVAVDHWHAEMLDLLLAQGSTIPDGLLTRVLRVQPHQFPLYIIRRLLQTAEFVKLAVTPWDNRRLLEAVVEDEEDYEQINCGDELILAARALVQAGCTGPLLLVAVEKGCIPVIRNLLSMTTSSHSDTPSSPHPSTILGAVAGNGDTPLHIAMKLSDENQCLIITKLLLNAGFSSCGLDADDKPPIHAAVVRGFVSVVEYLLSQDVPLPPRILFAALQTFLVKRVEVIRLLVSKGANVHVHNPDGDGLLHVVMRSLDKSVCLEIAEILIDTGCDPSAVNQRGETPLHIAAKQGYHEIVNYLILFSSSSDISSLLHKDSAVRVTMLRLLIGNANGLSLFPEEEAGLMEAVQQFLNDQEKCLEWTMVFDGAAGGLFARSAGCAMLLEVAARRKFSEVVEYLQFQDTPSTPATLLTAVRHKQSMIPSLICSGADVHIQDGNGNTLLHVAMSMLSETCCLKTTRILVQAGCNPFTFNMANEQPIHIAVSRGFKSVAEYLLSQALNAEASLSPDLLFAAVPSHKVPSVVRLLLDHKINVLYPASNGDYLLHAALRSSDQQQCLPTTEALFQAGLGSLAPNADGETPLHIAIARGLTSVVRYLLSRDVPLPSDVLCFALDWERSRTFRCWAPGWGVVNWTVSESNCLEMTKLFIDAGCSASVCDVHGQLPIKFAVTRRFPSVVEYLLSRDAPFPPDILFVVLGSRCSRTSWMVSLFIEHGADVRAISTNGDTILHSALGHHWGRDERDLLHIVKDFVIAGCDTSARDAEGRTPLEHATDIRLFDVAKYLQHGSAAPVTTVNTTPPSSSSMPSRVCPPPGPPSPSRGSPSLPPATLSPQHHPRSPHPQPPSSLPQSPLRPFASVLREFLNLIISSFSLKKLNPDNSEHGPSS
ncbi:ankyrin repeat-containing domain protein [Boletus coccyginus]|nr:ankyrin repeat-containing domain protein [Boletus coccyginus]